MDIQTRSEESSNSMLISQIPIPIKMQNIAIINWNAFSLIYLFAKDNKNPIIPPIASEAITSRKAIKIVNRIEVALATTRLFAIATHKKKIISPIASSRATTGNKVFVTIPFALYCLTTSSVAAGAVAVAIAPKIRIIGIVTWSGNIK